MSARELRERLAAIEPPGEQGARRRAAAAAAAALALSLSAVALATTRPGHAVTHWIDDVFSAPAVTQPRDRLPARGSVLAIGARGPFVLGTGGGRHALGRYSDAVWSPHGLYVAAVRGRQLAAVDPRGGVHWVLTATGPVADPRWSPDGFRIAYRAGARLRVVAGDGSGDRLASRAVAAVAPAWRPGRAHVLAFVTAGGGLLLGRLDRGDGYLMADGLAAARWIAWAGPHRLLAASPATVTAIPAGVLSATTRRRERTWHVPSGATIVSAAVSPTARHVAVLVRRAGVTRVVLLGSALAGRPRVLLAVRGALAGLAWSPDGRWLVAQQPRRSRWLLVPTSPGLRVRALPGLDGRIGGWCCVR
jgi:dipeptidyl aminopeptidase/acylaminoacyl peptidase